MARITAPSSWTLPALLQDYTDLLGEGYSRGGEARSEFHFEFVPAVLGDLETWAKESGADDLATTVSESRQRYDEYLSKWEPDER